MQFNQLSVFTMHSKLVSITVTTGNVFRCCTSFFCEKHLRNGIVRMAFLFEVDREVLLTFFLLGINNTSNITVRNAN